MTKLTNELAAIVARLNAEPVEIKVVDDREDDEFFASSDDHIIHA